MSGSKEYLSLNTVLHAFASRDPYLDVAGLLHKPAGVFCGSVTFGELDSKELESTFKVRLQEVLFRRLKGDMRRLEERVYGGGKQ